MNGPDTHLAGVPHAPPPYPARAYSGPVVRDWRERFMHFLLYMACFTMTWHLFRLGSINVTISDAALAMCLVMLAARGRLNPLPLGSYTYLWCIGLFMMLGALLISSLTHSAPMRWLIVAPQYLFAFLLVPMIFMSQDRAVLYKCLLYFAVGVAVSEAVGVAASNFLTYAQTKPILGPGFLIGNGRVGAFAGEANWNGASVAFALPMLILVWRRRLIHPIPAIICLIALIWGVLASASFTGFSAAMLGLILMFAISSIGNFIKIGLPLFAGLGVYVAAGLPLPGEFQQRVATALETGNIDAAGTFVDRSALISEAWHFASDTIFIGFGVDRYRQVSAYGAPVHNFPLLILTEGGIFALIGVIIMVSVLLWMTLLVLRRDREAGAMAFSVLTVLLIFSMAIPHMYTRLWIGPVLLALAACYSTVRRMAAPMPMPYGAMPGPQAATAQPPAEFPLESRSSPA